MDKKNIVGVVLAGGGSSRMGQDKALLEYNGAPLLDHMISILEQTGLSDVYVSGDFENYRCIRDKAPHEGPAYAMYDIMQKFDHYDGALFIPVDMPFLCEEALRLLINQKCGGYFTGHPLPAFVTAPYHEKRARSVKELLFAVGANPVALPRALEKCMINANTQEEWKEVVGA